MKIKKIVKAFWLAAVVLLCSYPPLWASNSNILINGATSNASDGFNYNGTVTVGQPLVGAAYVGNGTLPHGDPQLSAWLLGIFRIRAFAAGGAAVAGRLYGSGFDSLGV